MNIPLGPTNLKVLFCKDQYILNIVRNAKAKELGDLAEKITEIIYSLEPSNTIRYDYLINGKKIEIKSSRAYSKSKSRGMISISRLSTSNEYKCGIQHVKKDFFDVLYYTIFCEDGIQIFRIESNDLCRENLGNWSKEQKNNDNDYKFYIHYNNYNTHLKYLIQELSYGEIYDILKLDNYI